VRPGDNGGVLDALALAPRVLVVEDDPNVAEVVARYLEREGYRVETAGDGAVGLERALLDLPDLVVLDLCCRRWAGSRCAGGCARWRRCR
jgi:DNA-binding response OmpR family regulator